MTNRQKDIYDELSKKFNESFWASAIPIEVNLSGDVLIDFIFPKDMNVRISCNEGSIKKIPIDVFSNDIINNILTEFKNRIEIIEKISDNDFNDGQYSGVL